LLQYKPVCVINFDKLRRKIAIFFRDCIMCDFFAAAKQFHYYTLATLYVRIISFSSIIHGS